MASPYLKIHATSLSLASALGAACGPTSPATTEVETDPTASTSETGTGDPSTDPTTSTAPTDPTAPPPQCVEDSDCGGYCEYCYDGQCDFGGPGCCGFGVEPAPGGRGWRCSPPPYYDCYDDLECAEDEVCIDHECVPASVPIPQCPSDPIDPSAWNLAGPPSNLVLADLDGDGDLDVAAALITAPARLQLSFNDGAGVFTPAEPIELDGAPMGLAADDLDGDGAADLVFTTVEPDGVFVASSASDFMLGSFTPTDAPPREVFAGNFNADEFTDVVTIDSAVGNALVLLGDGAGALAPPLPTSATSALGSASMADLDGDGRDDIVAVVAGEGVGVVWSAPDGTLTGGMPLAVDPPLTHAHAGVFEPSMLPALFATRDFATSGGIVVWTGFEIGLWNDPREFTTAAPLRGGATADFDGDGFVDVISATGGDTLAVLLADGLGAFACEQTYPGPGGDTSARLLAVGDVNGDGRVDIVTAEDNGAIVALRH